MRNLRVCLFAIALLVGGAALAQGPRRDLGEDLPAGAGATGANADQPFTLSIDVDLVNVDVVVTTRADEPIAGLERDQFRVFVDGVEQTITNFSPAEAPVTVALVIEFAETFAYYYDDVLGPSWGFIQSLRPDDWIALVNFDRIPQILTDFTRDRNELLGGLQRLTLPTFRETAVFDAIMFTLDRMENIDGKKAIFLLTAGFDTISRSTYPQALDEAESSDTIIYAVGLGQLFRTVYDTQLGAIDRISFAQAENSLRQIAEASGGAAFFPRFQNEYFGIFDLVGAHMRYQYSLGFVPEGLEEDDDLKEIRVEMAPIDADNDGEPDDLRVKHKRGFYLTPRDEG